MEDITEHCRQTLADIQEQYRTADCDIQGILIRLENVFSIIDQCYTLNLLEGAACYEALNKIHQAIELVNYQVQNHSLDYTYTPALLYNDKRGRPRCQISTEQLEFLVEYGLPISIIGKIVGVSERTIYRRLTENGITNKAYTELSQGELLNQVREITQVFPNIGYRRLDGFLRAKGIRIRQVQLREALRLVDPIGSVQRRLGLHFVRRRKYSVPYPGALWHFDGNHKLIRWRMVIHGCVDGFSRKIMYLHAASNNKASTVLSLFVGATDKYGIPRRIRCDKGGENTGVARWLLEHGVDRSCIIVGRSVHNQRIERMWRDLWEVVTGNYYQLFRYLESQALLEPTDECHLFCLHYVMLPRINQHLQLFQAGWDAHPLSSERNRTPNQLWIEGAACHPECLQRSYLTSGHGNATYGIDWEGPFAGHAETSDVEVPETSVQSMEHLTELLQCNINPIEDSDNWGINLYLAAIELVRDM